MKTFSQWLQHRVSEAYGPVPATPVGGNQQNQQQNQQQQVDPTIAHVEAMPDDFSRSAKEITTKGLGTSNSSLLAALRSLGPSVRAQIDAAKKADQARQAAQAKQNPSQMPAHQQQQPGVNPQQQQQQAAAQPG